VSAKSPTNISPTTKNSYAKFQNPMTILTPFSAQKSHSACVSALSKVVLVVTVAKPYRINPLIILAIS
jgi:hypothetical protein